MTCTCFIVPADVLRKLGEDTKLPDDIRRNATDSARISVELRKLRIQAGKLTKLAGLMAAGAASIAASPKITVYNCKNTQTLPGTPIPTPSGSADATVKRTLKETSGVAAFYKQVFDRNSVDDKGATLMSSVHYGVKYNNAMWNGTQMVYGDGDNALFVDFTNGNDVIGHELTHGVTQNTLQLSYTSDAGGLNESLSDCFGIMFRQWEANQDANSADWLIGATVMGPTAKSKGYTCLRNMADPADKKALAPQPVKYAQITPGMDPHYSSGPPNLAFCTACKTLGGKSWEKVGQVWYHAMTDFGPSPNLKMKAFADRTRKLATSLYPTTPAVSAAIDKGWKLVGL